MDRLMLTQTYHEISRLNEALLYCIKV